jgi:hypothetical protein
MTVSGLRRERDHGRLAVFKIAGKDFTTLADIGRMMELCRSEAKGPDCGLSQGDRSETSAPCGSSATAQTNTALALARAKVSKLKERSPTTSSPTQASRDRATVIPLKSDRRRDCNLRRRRGAGMWGPTQRRRGWLTFWISSER